MKIGAYVKVFSTINLKTEKIENVQVLNKKGVKIDAMIEPGATLWFDNDFILHYIIHENGIKWKGRGAQLQRVKLN